MKNILRPPFPYYGGKGKVAEEVWRRFGTVKRYIEPCAGSLAILLNNPNHASMEIVCDTDGMVCNFWRAVADDPHAVHDAIDYPVIHQDLYARHKYIRNWSEENKQKLLDDPFYYDAQVAGFWAWGKSSWIGRDWCYGPLSDIRPVVPMSGKGLGAQAFRAKWPYGSLLDWLLVLHKRIKTVCVLNRDWSSSLTKPLLGVDPANTAVFFDPPYRMDTGRSDGMYVSDENQESNDIAEDTYQWSVEHGNDMKVAYCCHEGDYPVPEGWDAIVFDFHRTKSGNRDMIMFSPTCNNKERVAKLF